MLLSKAEQTQKLTNRLKQHAVVSRIVCFHMQGFVATPLARFVCEWLQQIQSHAEKNHGPLNTQPLRPRREQLRKVSL